MPRNRFVKILLFPISAALFMIGFALMSVGDRKQKTGNTPVSKNNSPTFEIGILAPQENQPLILETQRLNHNE